MLNFEKYSNFEKRAYIENFNKDISNNYCRKASVILFRHGHRTPFNYGRGGLAGSLGAEFYSKLNMDCFNNKQEKLYQNFDLVSYGSLQKKEEADFYLQFNTKLKQDGILTRLGSEQLYSLGLSLGDRYQKEVDQIVGDDANQLLRAVSTRTERTIESLKGVLAGLFNSKQIQPHLKIFVFDETCERNWLLIPYEKYPELLDGLCKSHKHDFKREQIPGYEKWSSDFMDRTGAESEELDLSMIRDFVTSFKTFDMMIGSDHTVFNDNDLSALNQMTMYSVSSETLLVDKGVGKAAGEFFWHLLEILDSNDRILTFLSAHDTTINFVKLALGGVEYQWPDFGANIEFELYEENVNKKLFIVVLYNLNPVVLMDISRDSSPLIPYDDFVQYVKENIFN